MNTKKKHIIKRIRKSKRKWPSNKLGISESGCIWYSTTLSQIYPHWNWNILKSTLGVLPLVTRTKPYCFPTVYQRLNSVGFQLLISNYWTPTEITLEKTFIQPLKDPTFQTENQPFWNVGNTFLTVVVLPGSSWPSIKKSPDSNLMVIFCSTETVALKKITYYMIVIVPHRRSSDSFFFFHFSPPHSLISLMVVH